MKWFRLAAILLLAAVFIAFTWRSIGLYFSDDDLMNTWEAWSVKPPLLIESLFLIGKPVVRPLGGAIYVLLYRFFGFHAQPLYLFSWLFLVGNAVLAWRLFREVTGGMVVAFIALSLTLVHSGFSDLYYNAGTIYDRLWFLFTVLGVLTYARWRSRDESPTWRGALLIVLISLAAMDSKESGVTLPALLACYELTCVRRRWREVIPLFAVLAVLCLIFIARVDRTESLSGSAYAHHLTLSVWMTRVGAYLGMLLYQTPLSALVLALVFLGMAAAALWLRNRAMIFGLLWFIVTITPLAAIDLRNGYVLYVPELGLGLFVAAGLAALLRTEPRLIAAFFLLTLGLTKVNASRWTQAPDSSREPRYILTQQFLRDYPYGWPRESHLLFAHDAFARDSYSLFFNLSLLYHDRTIHVDRIDAPADQQPDWRHPPHYARVFTYDDARYIELDERDPEQSVRLNILKGSSLGRQVKFYGPASAGYIVSGVMTGGPQDEGRWITPHAQLKFDLFPAPATLFVRYYIPDVEAVEPGRSLQLSVNGKAVGSAPLSQKNSEIRFSVPTDQITRNGYTLVNLDVSPGFKTSDGTELGLVLIDAGFEYR